MLYNMYSVKDEMTGKFMNPMFIQDGETADREATRNFATNVNEIAMWRSNPNDFSLYKVGVFNDEEGAASTVITKIASGRSVLNVGIDTN